MKTTSFPARVYVLFAREADYAIIIRRGPAKKVCTIGWNRENDTFTLGQWLYGRIYEERCDISPDGKHFIYFAWKDNLGSETGEVFTAISRVPYLKAIGLWRKDDRWGGGGIFKSNSKFCINETGAKHFPLLEPIGFVEVRGNLNWKDKLAKHGWKCVECRERVFEDNIVMLEKQLPSSWMLRKICISTMNHPVGKGCNYEQHQLRCLLDDRTVDHPDWEWADSDERGIYWAEKGKLFKAQISSDGLSEVSELYDFNNMVYQQIEAPY